MPINLTFVFNYLPMVEPALFREEMITNPKPSFSLLVMVTSYGYPGIIEFVSAATKVTLVSIFKIIF